MKPSSGSCCPIEATSGRDRSVLIFHTMRRPARPPARAGERGVGRLRELSRPEIESRIARRARHLVEGVHPLGQVVEVLAVPVPLEPLVERLPGTSLRQRLADAQTAAGRMGLALPLAQPADPAGARDRRPDSVRARDAPGRPAGARDPRRRCSPVRRASPRKLQTAKASVHRYRCVGRSDVSPVRSAKRRMSRVAFSMASSCDGIVRASASPRPPRYEPAGAGCAASRA